MSSKTDERANQILRLLLSHGKTSVEELTDEPFRFDASFETREDRFAKEKRRIAAAAAEMIAENETIGFSAGTTTAQIAHLLKHRKHLNIVTNAVNISMELSPCSALNTVLTGGSLRWPGAFTLVGSTAIDSLSAFLMHRVFIGVCGIDVAHGASIIEPEEAAVVRAMVRNAKQVVVVADSSKAGQCSPALICPVSAIDLLITDDGISDEVLAAFSRQKIQVLVV